MQGDRQDLRARTKRFAGSIIHLYAKLPRRHVPIDIIGRQLLRSATSVAANYREASRARSRAGFVSKIETCLQEADETQLWLELLRDDCGVELS
jgi:four helix bundle protein